MRPIKLIRVACLFVAAVACSSSDGTPSSSGSGSRPLPLPSPARHVGRGRVLEDRWPADRGRRAAPPTSPSTTVPWPSAGTASAARSARGAATSLPAERERQGDGAAAALRPGRSPVQSRTNPDRRQRLRHRPLHARRDAGRHVDVQVLDRAGPTKADSLHQGRSGGRPRPSSLGQPLVAPNLDEEQRRLRRRHHEGRRCHPAGVRPLPDEVRAGVRQARHPDRGGASAEGAEPRAGFSFLRLEPGGHDKFIGGHLGPMFAKPTRR